MPLTGREAIVLSPPRRPPASGLVAAADVVNHTDDAWLAGVTFQSANTASIELYDLCSSDGTVSIATGATSVLGIGTTFAVEQREQCSGFGYSDVNFQARALEGLLARESWAVERQFELNTLAIAGFSNLAQNASTTPVGTTGVQTIKALSLLDQAIADANIGQGMIHATPYIVDLWANAGGLIIGERGGRILSPQGNIIVSGNGYTGAAPSATVPAPAGALPTTATPGFVYAYATGLVVLHRDATPTVNPPSLSEALDRSLNTIRYRAHRAYAIARNGQLNAAIKIVVDHTAAP